ncbi:mobilisation protein [Hymenobacter roseosalivarius DSM 11622]|uniref:Mobilisation protein n=1 Tax=Hymenobacter roseosalivarius DSM 11622 TaxID=645990 RepID=A0A1W1W4Z9_9BACT|nr:MobC family plasmid mobilization relaxosome protein [Hymenobacter roseosalivarius]SMC00685.1 mobilisation protein [Hymenobacter roseosalivarius DSM 11622]
MPELPADSATTPKPKRLGGRPKKDPADKLKSITTHVSVARYEELEAGAAEVRQPISQYVRPLVEGGIKPRKRPVLQLSGEQEGYLRQLAGLANNLNQLAKKAHQSGFGAVGEEVVQQARRVSQLLDYFGDVA